MLPRGCRVSRQSVVQQDRQPQRAQRTQRFRFKIFSVFFVVQTSPPLGLLKID